MNSDFEILFPEEGENVKILKEIIYLLTFLKHHLKYIEISNKVYLQKITKMLFIFITRANWKNHNLLDSDKTTELRAEIFTTENRSF